MIMESKAFIRSLRWLIKSFLSDNSYLRQSGFINSLKVNHPADMNGRPLPWMNHSFMTFISPRLKGLSVFEYGSGYSTIFWASECRKVVAFEHQQDWCRNVSQMLLPYENAEVRYAVDKDEYVGAIEGHSPDLVIIDGIYRVDCLKRSAEVITDSAVIIVDDSYRISLRKHIEHLKCNGYKEIVSSGPKAGHINTFYTSVIYKKKNIMNI